MDLNDIKTAVANAPKVEILVVDSNRFGWDNPKYADLETPARSVIASYQNANRWLDTIKEHLLINLNLPFFSDFVHNLAHRMPARFDKFGDILHKENLLVPYPSTEEWLNPCGDVKSCIHLIYDILDHIKIELVNFKKVAEDIQLLHLSIECDSLLLDIQSEYDFLYKVEGLLNHYGSNLGEWDIAILQYYEI